VFEKLNAGIFLVLVNKPWFQSMIRKISRGPGQEFKLFGDSRNLCFFLSL
jgi:hypothetical protein